MRDDFPLFVKWSDSTDWILNTVEKFPKSVRFTIYGRIANITLDVMEGIIEAIYTKERRHILEKINLYIEKLMVKCYIRYMDDIVVFADSKNYLKQILKYMKDYLSNTLFLSLNSRVTLLNSRLHGLPFLGLRIFPNLIRIRSENLKRIKKKLNLREFEYNTGLINEDRFVMSVRSVV